MGDQTLPTNSTDYYLVACLVSIAFVLQGCPDHPTCRRLGTQRLGARRLCGPPTYDKCWMIMPTGCSRLLGETGEPTDWFVDSSSYDSATCATRMSEYNRRCNRSDATSHWGWDHPEKPSCTWRGKQCPKCEQKTVNGRSHCPSCKLYIEGKCEGHFDWGDECPKEYVDENCGKVLKKGKTQDLCKRTLASASTKEDLCPEWVALGCETRLEDHCDMDIPWGGFRRATVKDECWETCTACDAAHFCPAGSKFRPNKEAYDGRSCKQELLEIGGWLCSLHDPSANEWHRHSYYHYYSHTGSLYDREFVREACCIREALTESPTESATVPPTEIPTSSKKESPTDSPAASPTAVPTAALTEPPTESPTRLPE